MYRTLRDHYYQTVHGWHGTLASKRTQLSAAWKADSRGFDVD